MSSGDENTSAPVEAGEGLGSEESNGSTEEPKLPLAEQLRKMAESTCLIAASMELRVANQRLAEAMLSASLAQSRARMNQALECFYERRLDTYDELLLRPRVKACSQLGDYAGWAVAIAIVIAALILR